ncbi:MAG: hypothetical protein ACRDSJ_17030 [Rubrobacteraceae bacterium]
MKAPSFVPTVAEITPADVDGIPGLEAVILYWTGGSRSAEECVRSLRENSGSAGLFVRRGDDVLGFLVYGPRSELSRAEEYPVDPVGPLERDGILLAYVEGDARTCRRLLVRMLRDLKGRGVGKVEAIASDLGVSRHVPTSLLLESGWRPVRSGWLRGKPYTLVCIDLGNAVEVGELAKGLLGRVRLPSLGRRAPAPGAFTSVENSTAEFRGAGPRS